MGRRSILVVQGGAVSREYKMGKTESGGSASTYIYGLIFVLYAGIAIVLFIYMMHKRSKQQKPEESVESEGKDGEEGNVAKASCSQPAKETSQAPTGEKSSAAKEKKSQVDESEAKETTF